MEPPPAPPSKWRVALPRLLLAHGLAYPIAFAWAIAVIPACIVTIPDRVILESTQEAVVQIVLRRLAWPSLVVFVLEHGTALPWSFGWRVGRDAGRGRRFFWLASAALFAVALVGGGASWLWLVLR